MPRPRLPTNILEFQGTLRKSRRPANEPRPPVTRLRAPAHLSKHAKAAWTRYAPLLDRLGVLTDLDALTLERACECYSEIRTLQETIARDGASYRPPLLTRNGEPILDASGNPVCGMSRMRPEVPALADADRRLAGWLSKLGMSPADRSRVSADPSAAVANAVGAEYFT